MLSQTSAKTFVVVALLSALAVQARFPCANPKYTKWTGPDGNNSVSDCGWVDWIVDERELIASLVAPLALAVLVLVFYPFVMLFRYCCQCCGGSRRRPGGCCCGPKKWDDEPDEVVNREYSACSVYTVKLLALAVCVGSGVAIILMSAGFKKFDDHYNQFFDDLKELILWAQGRAQGIRDAMTLPDGTLVPPLNESFFDEFDNKTSSLNNDIDKIKHDVNVKFYDLVNLIQKIVTYAPIGFLSLVPMCALCNIRICLPGLTTFFFWLCCVVFLIVGGVFFITGNVLDNVCLEIDAQFDKEPGLFQWYIVPKCEAELPFESFEKQISTIEVENANLACTELIGLCSDNVTFNESEPTDLFWCGATLSAPTSNVTQLIIDSCPTFGDVRRIMGEIRVKDDVPDNISGVPVPPVCTAVANEDCTVVECAASCRETSLKDIANLTLKYVDFANRTFTAYRTYVQPLMDCNVLFNITLGPLKNCHEFASSLMLVGSGAIVYGVFFCLGIIVMLLGQKRFFSRSNVAESDDEDDAPKKKKGSPKKK